MFSCHSNNKPSYTQSQRRLSETTLWFMPRRRHCGASRTGQSHVSYWLAHLYPTHNAKVPRQGPNRRVVEVMSSKVFTDMGEKVQGCE